MDEYRMAATVCRLRSTDPGPGSWNSNLFSCHRLTLITSFPKLFTVAKLSLKVNVGPGLDQNPSISAFRGIVCLFHPTAKATVLFKVTLLTSQPLHSVPSSVQLVKKTDR